MSNFLSQNLNVFYLLLSCASLVGAFLVGRRGRAKEINEAATQLNETLNREIEALRRRVADLEKDRNRQYDILDTIRYALRQEGLSVVIDGEFVSLLKQGAPNKITRIRSRVSSVPLPQEEQDQQEERG